MDQDVGLPDVWRVLVAHKVNRSFFGIVYYQYTASVDDAQSVNFHVHV